MLCHMLIWVAEGISALNAALVENITHITKKTPQLTAKILATNFGFEPDCLCSVFIAWFS